MIAALLAPKLIVLYAFVLAAIFVHFRGRERLRFVRQITDHSTFMAPYNAFVYLCSAVPNRPILDVSVIPELGVLRENWTLIRDEALALSDGGLIARAQGYTDLSFNSFFKKGWKRFYLKWYEDYLPSARAACPRTVELLERVPGVNAAMFALMAPNSRLVRHRDPFAGSLRYHLGLVTPNSEECRIFIDGIAYHWRDGHDVLFDETYVHAPENLTGEPRIILFCDVERPLHGAVPRLLNRLMARHVVSATTSANVPGERIGFLNKVFRCVYPIRLVAKRLKKFHTPTYRVVNLGLYFGVLYLIFS